MLLTKITNKVLLLRTHNTWLIILFPVWAGIKCIESKNQLIKKDVRIFLGYEGFKRGGDKRGFK